MQIYNHFARGGITHQRLLRGDCFLPVRTPEIHLHADEHRRQPFRPTFLLVFSGHKNHRHSSTPMASHLCSVRMLAIGFNPAFHQPASNKVYSHPILAAKSVNSLNKLVVSGPLGYDHQAQDARPGLIHDVSAIRDGGGKVRDKGRGGYIAGGFAQNHHAPRHCPRQGESRFRAEFVRVTLRRFIGLWERQCDKLRRRSLDPDGTRNRIRQFPLRLCRHPGRSAGNLEQRWKSPADCLGARIRRRITR